MDTQPRPTHDADDKQRVVQADAASTSTDRFAVSAGIGPIPPVFVAEPLTDATAARRMHQAMVRAARVAGSWALGHLSRFTTVRRRTHQSAKPNGAHLRLTVDDGTPPARR
jgi:hypothetical protein